MLLVKEITTKTYKYASNGISNTYIEEVEQYHYRNEEEKLAHKKQMEEKGFEDSGQVREDINHSIMNPEYVWFGSYYRSRLI